MKQRIEALISSTITSNDVTNDDVTNNDVTNNDVTHYDTIIYPLVQMSPFDIKQDDMVTRRLLKEAKTGDSVFLATGYFNLTDVYRSLIVDKCLANFHILTAAPQVRVARHTWKGPSHLK